MGRTLHNLEERNSILVHPFRWYGNMFMRVTTAVSRRQEFGADALAARVVGERALAGGLERVHAAGPMFYHYWQMEVLPVLMSGRRPPLAEGFSMFLSGPQMAEGYAQLLQFAKEAEQDVYDTHPPLRARLQSIAGIGEAPAESFDEKTRAIELLADLDQTEQSLIKHLTPQNAPTLTPIEWNAVGQDVWMPIWQARVKEAEQRLKGVTPTELAGVSGNPTHLAVRMNFAADASVTMDQHRGEALSIFGAALCVAFIARGWTVHAEPGAEVRLTRESLEIKPFTAHFDLLEGRMQAAEWEALCQAANIADIDLATKPAHAIAQ
jgi:heat shock protein HtpX